MKVRPGVWLVSSRHRVTVGDWRNPEWRPFSEHHARQVGAARTLCGQVAIEWPMFWDMEFDPSHGNSCPECATRRVDMITEKKD